MSSFFEGARLVPGQAVDFTALFAGVRALAPKCVDCQVPLDEDVTGIRTRSNDQGGTDEICRACAVSAIGERLLLDTPK